MGKNIKIELELPEFEKELVVSVILRRDGEAITASSDPGVYTSMTGTGGDSGSAWKQAATTMPKAQPSSGMSGNMMDMNF